MQRSKVMAVVAALVAAGTAAVLFAGGASAASWHVYQGDMFAGHAYGLQVPADAESVEFSFEGEDDGLATIGVYSPGGKKIGSYELSSELTAASIANPAAGQYVVYVYEVVDGALSVRVAADEEPALELAEIDLVREDVKIGTFPQGPLDQAITTELKAQPVFLTLLYSGSAKGLDATVASPTANVVTIEDETASAFSPGVWTTLKGERSFDPAGLEGLTYTVEAHAEQFEGTMVLTTLALDLAAPVAPKPGVPQVSHTHPEHAHVPTAAPAVAGPSVFAIVGDAPLAFEAEAGTLVLAAPVCDGDEHEDAHEHEAARCYGAFAIIALYTPDDELLTVVSLDDETPVAEVELPVDGEYVAFARTSEDDVVLAQLVGTREAPTLRALATEEEIVEFDLSAFAQDEVIEFELANIPLGLTLTFDSGLSALSSAIVENENGVVVSMNDPASVGGLGFMQWSGEDVENFASGAHTFTYGGFYEGSMTLTSLHYLRNVVAEEIVIDEDVDAEPEEPADPASPPAPPMPPAPPEPPLARLGDLVVGLFSP